MARSEFRWNKKRKHYAYLFKDCGDYRKNLLIHSNQGFNKCSNSEERKAFKHKNTRLFRHPNPNKKADEIYWVENRVYVDHCSSFEGRTYKWSWHANGKRQIKRLKKGRRTR